MSIVTDTTRSRTGLLLPGLRGLKTGTLAIGSGAVSLAGAAAILGLLWAAAAWQSDLPGPISTMGTFWKLLRDPFYDNDPNDKGIGLQLLASLERVFTGFALSALVAIPLGVLLGSNRIVRRFFDPVVQVLKPVSPLAWFPIGLVVLQSQPHAAVFVVFICSLWPTVINTAAGVSSIPESHKNVARVFQFNAWKYLTRIVLPHSLPYIISGLRLSMGVAWLVIVAAEMLSGSTGVGFYVWDSYNASNFEAVLSAILFIGIIGLALDRLFAGVGSLFSYPEVA